MFCPWGERYILDGTSFVKNFILFIGEWAVTSKAQDNIRKKELTKSRTENTIHMANTVKIEMDYSVENQ